MAQELKRILIVEDDEDIRVIARIALEAVGGFEVESCETGAKAALLARTFRPHLVVLDVTMPDMDGPTTLRAMRKEPGLELTPVIFLTAKHHPQELRELEQLGALGVIQKPFDAMRLPSHIQQLWKRRFHTE
ncbi:MAG TPA: response regulator [Polyangiaceae bacterium]|nr:response regulator [Polyangiaceae bacterium]